MPQARAHGAEVIVVADGDDGATAQVAGSQGAALISLDRRSGANAARNAGVAGSAGDLVVFVDDDIEAQPGWLEALLRAAAERADRDVFGGPIAARLEGGGPRACGREAAPITTLDGGPSDREIEFVWSANMAIRRSALERIGEFDETIHGRGEEEEWEQRYKAAGGRVEYVAGARRRAPPCRRRRDRRRPVARLLRTRPDRASQRRAHGPRPVAAGRAADARGLRLAHRQAALRERHRDGRPQPRPRP